MTTVSFLREQKQYQVPTRFGMSAMLVFMTLFGFLFAALRYLDAWPVMYLFFASLAMATGITQMRMGGVPRIASAAAGAILLPLWIFAGVFFMGQQVGQQNARYLLLAALTLPITAPAGALIGYFSGTLMAGVFLTLDLTEKWFVARHAKLRAAQTPPADDAPDGSNAHG